MNRHEYMARLEAGLAGIPGGERDEAMAYYEEYFDEAGPQNEERVIGELGSPERVAEQIKADFAAKEYGQPGASAAKRGVSAVWWVILGIFALPVALPVAILLCVSLFLMLVAAAVLIIVFVAVAAAAFICGAAAFAAGIATVFTSLATGLFYMGCGMVLVGLAILVCLLLRALVRAIAGGVKRFFNWVRRRARQRNEDAGAGKGGKTRI